MPTAKTHDTRLERARTLYWQARREYHLMDRRWQQNLRDRLHRLARQTNRRDAADGDIAMYLDNATFYVGIQGLRYADD